MRLAMIAFAAAAGLAASANAQTGRLSDLDFVRVAECSGYAHGLKADASKLDALLKTEGRGRSDAIGERADGARDSAESRARGAKGVALDQIHSELAGACAALTAG
jgi:hypothetical protein